MIRQRELDLITYKTPLALHFIDAVTNQPIRDGLHVLGWPFVADNPQPVHRIVAAEKSMKSAIYGFRTLPGLERYQRGNNSDEITPGSRQYVIQIEDQQGRFLPQITLFDLPLDEPAVQKITLYPAPTRPTPPGYATIRGDIHLTTTPPAVGEPEVSKIGPASWARITLTVGDDMVESISQFFADGQGRFVGMAPLPILPPEQQLSNFRWDVAIRIDHNASAIEEDSKNLLATRPDLDPVQTPPFQATLEIDNAATVIGTVTVDDSADPIIYRINSTGPSFEYQFGKPLVIQTKIEGTTNYLSEILIHN